MSASDNPFKSAAQPAAVSLKANELRQADAAHHVHPFSDNHELAQHGVRFIERAQGVYVWDAEGNRFLDGFAGLWCVNLGYGRKELIDAASKQLSTLPYYNLFFKTSTAPATQLAQTIAELAPEGMNHVLFTGGGSEANDSIFRLVRRYWDLQEQPEKKHFISRKNAYHGSTVCGASLGGMSWMHTQGDLPIAGISHIEQPYYFELGNGMDEQAFGVHSASWLEQEILRIGADKVAAFIGEPIQGAGGVIIPPMSYWPEIERICKKYQVLLVADEVICGFGRLGQWFGSQHFQFQPDVMAIAKGLSSGYLPIGGVVIRDTIARVLIERGGDFNHGFTYSGHPVCAAVALENLRILKNEQIVDKVRTNLGPYLTEQLQQIAQHPLVGEVRNVGLVAGIELVKDKGTRARCGKPSDTGSLCRDKALQQGLIIRATGDTMLLSPPLVISRTELDEMMDKFRAALDSTQKELGL